MGLDSEIHLAMLGKIKTNAIGIKAIESVLDYPTQMQVADAYRAKCQEEGVDSVTGMKLEDEEC